MIFCNSESLGNDFFFYIKFKNHKIIHRQLDIVLPCKYVTISLIQIYEKKRKLVGQSVIIQPQLN